MLRFFHTKSLLTLLALLLMIGMTGCSLTQEADKPNKLNWPVQNFNYTDQDGHPFGLSDLKGHVWLADFIFTSCTSVCPPMTANMAALQKKMKEAGLTVPIVSFSVDPEVDKPSMLKKFGEKFGADFTTWHFLTGYTPAEIKELSESSFKTALEKTPDSNQVTHGTSFFLVDQNGTIVSRYEGVPNPPFDQIVQDIQDLN